MRISQRREKQVAFRVQTDAAILGAGIVLAGGADAYPAPPATSRHHPKLAASFSPHFDLAQCRPTRNATCGSPPWRNAMDFRCSRLHRILFNGAASASLILNPDSCILDTAPPSRLFACFVVEFLSSSSAASRLIIFLQIKDGKIMARPVDLRTAFHILLHPIPAK